MAAQIRADNTFLLDSTSAWNGGLGPAPSASDVATWNGVVTNVNTKFNANLTWGGIELTAAQTVSVNISRNVAGLGLTLKTADGIVINTASGDLDLQNAGLAFVPDVPTTIPLSVGANRTLSILTPFINNNTTLRKTDAGTVRFFGSAAGGVFNGSFRLDAGKAEITSNTATFPASGNPSYSTLIYGGTIANSSTADSVWAGYHKVYGSFTATNARALTLGAIGAYVVFAADATVTVANAGATGELLFRDFRDDGTARAFVKAGAGRLKPVVSAPTPSADSFRGPVTVSAGEWDGGYFGADSTSLITIAAGTTVLAGDAYAYTRRPIAISGTFNANTANTTQFSSVTLSGGLIQGAASSAFSLYPSVSGAESVLESGTISTKFYANPAAVVRKTTLSPLYVSGAFAAYALRIESGDFRVTGGYQLNRSAPSGAATTTVSAGATLTFAPTGAPVAGNDIGVYRRLDLAGSVQFVTSVANLAPSYGLGSRLGLLGAGVIGFSLASPSSIHAVAFSSYGTGIDTSGGYTLSVRPSFTGLVAPTANGASFTLPAVTGDGNVELCGDDSTYGCVYYPVDTTLSGTEKAFTGSLLLGRQSPTLCSAAPSGLQKQTGWQLDTNGWFGATPLTADGLRFDTEGATIWYGTIYLARAFTLGGGTTEFRGSSVKLVGTGTVGHWVGSAGVWAARKLVLRITDDTASPFPALIVPDKAQYGESYLDLRLTDAPTAVTSLDIILDAPSNSPNDDNGLIIVSGNNTHTGGTRLQGYKNGAVVNAIDLIAQHRNALGAGDVTCVNSVGIRTLRASGQQGRLRVPGKLMGDAVYGLSFAIGYGPA